MNEQQQLFDPEPFTEPESLASHSLCMGLLVRFRGGEELEYPVHHDGDWTYDQRPPRLIVRPHGRGVPRHEIPLGNVLSVMLRFVEGHS